MHDASSATHPVVENLPDVSRLSVEIHRKIVINKKIPLRTIQLDPPAEARLVEEWEIGK